MTQTLGQLNASRKTIKTDFETFFNALFQRLAPKKELWEGFSRKFTPMAESDVPPGVILEQRPDESKKVQFTVREQLALLKPLLENYVNTETSLDASNQVAFADVRIGGSVIASEVPATALLFWRGQLEALHTAVAALPALDPSSDWTFNSSRDCYVAPAVETRFTEKQARGIPVFAPTETQAGQFIPVQDDVRTGTWTKTVFSGAMEASVKRVLLGRIREVQLAVKAALEEANRKTEAVPRNDFSAVADFIFASADGVDVA